jgi:DNA helicase-2/ATP-dependent DNA helicase PcrA
MTLQDGFGPGAFSNKAATPTLGAGFSGVTATIPTFLNEQQKAVVTSSIGGVKLVIAGAGTGKTTGCILARADYLYAKRPGKIAIMAFNKSVQLELEERVQTALSPIAAANTSVFTNHGIAYRLVMKNLNLLTLPAKTEVIDKDWKMIAWLKEQRTAEMGKSVTDRLPDFEPIFLKFTDPQMRALLMCEEVSGARGIPVGLAKNDFKLLKETATEYVEKFLRWARLNRCLFGKLMFRDLLPLAARLPAEAYESFGFKHILVDEAQDLNVDQHAVISKFSSVADSVLMVGDPSQCIYKFNGSRPDLFTNISNSYANVETFHLSINYRSDQPILNLANSLLEKQLKSPIVLTPDTSKPGTPVVNLADPKSMVPWIQSELKSGRKPTDIAILYRVNAHALKVEIALTQAGIPYQSRSGSFFEHSAVQDIFAYLRFLHPSSERTQEDWETIVGHMKYLGQKTADAAWSESKGKPLAMRLPPSTIKTRGQREAWQQLLHRCDLIAEFMLASNNNPSVDLDYITNHYVKPSWEERWADDPERLAEAEMIANALIEWAAGYRNIPELLQFAKEMAIQDPNGIVLSTVHKAKGLEWPVVILWNLGDGTFPLSHSRVDYEEEMCILYVAVTRAKKNLVLIKSSETSAGSMLHRLSDEQSKQFQELLTMLDGF